LFKYTYEYDYLNYTFLNLKITIMFIKILKLQPILTNVYLNGIDEWHCSWDSDKLNMCVYYTVIECT